MQHENWIEQAQILARGEETAFSRRMDRREVTGGTGATWTPTAPQEVAKAAAAPAPARAPEPIRAAPPPPPAPVAAVSPAVATAAAAATAAIATVAATAKPAISMRPAPAAGNARRFVRLAAPEGRADDISLISGVGDKVAGELNRYGIYHFWQVSAMGPDDIDYLEQRLALRGRIRREEWQEQARELMAGRPPRGAMDRARLAQAEAKVAAPAAAPVQAPVQAAPATPAVQAAVVAAPAVVAAAAAVVAPKPVTPPPPTVQPVLPPLAARPPVQATPAPAPVAIPTQVPPPPVVAKPVQVAPAPAAAPAAAPVAPGPRRFTRLAAPEGKPDDLSLISGVGPDLSAELNRYGIHHYWQLAAMVPEDVDYLEQRLNMRGRVKRDEWQEQSRELMAGRQPRGAMDRARMIQAEAQARMAEARTPAASVAPPAPPAAPVVPTIEAKPVAAPVVPPAAPAAAPVVQAKPAAPPPQPAPVPVAVNPPPAPAPTSPAAAATAIAAASAVAAATGASLSSTRAAAAASAPPTAPVTVAPTPAQAPVADAPAPGNDWVPRSRPAGGQGRAAKDDLKRIKGIGVVIEKRLEALGFTTYAQLAQWTQGDIDRVSNSLDFKGRIEREQWVHQANILASGRETDFSRRMDRGDGQI